MGINRNSFSGRVHGELQILAEIQGILFQLNIWTERARPLSFRLEMHMEQQDAIRKLTTIFSADVKGYSRLMGDDEVATIRTLTAYREIISSLIENHRGRVVDSPGDNLLAEFASAVDGVRCSVEIQKILKEKNTELLEHRRMEFRIGINVGDVIIEHERIYGDGVNIAARLESLAEPGGICISGTTYDQVESKLDLTFEFGGEQSVKNISKPLRVYQIKTEWKFPVHLGTLAVPDKPSIAVLPFVNMSGDIEQEYFSDGITEDLITDLSKISCLFVIARTSVFFYKDKSTNHAQVSRELGVRYLLEGSVRKAGGRVRITAQLIDASTGFHIWAERYDRELSEIFSVQDDVTKEIVVALKAQLTEAEECCLEIKNTENWEAYDFVLRGMEYLNRSIVQEENTKARVMFEKAISLDRNYANAYENLGWTYLRSWAHGWSQDLKILDHALDNALKAIELDETLPGGHRLLGHTYLWKKQHDLAIKEANYVIELDPNNADGYLDLGEILSWSGKPEDAIGLVEKAMRLNPRYHFHYLWTLGHAHTLMGNFEDAITKFNQLNSRDSDFMPSHAYLAFIHSEMGRMEEARFQMAEVKRLSPGSSIDHVKEKLPYRDETTLKRVISAMEKAMK